MVINLLARCLGYLHMGLRSFLQHIQSISNALRLTASHLYRNIKSSTHKHGAPLYQEGGIYQEEGIITLAYPHEKLPVPDRGRYKLHNDIEDCIVCDKCAKICPVDCIEIDAIPAPDVIGVTTNGMKKRIYAAKFDIDLAKCCFCGLCTTVCPTACLTMTPEYDYSVFDILEHKVSFAEMSEEERIGELS